MNKEAFEKAVMARISANGKKWVQVDSMHIIGLVVKDAFGKDLPEASLEWINRVVNPSAFRLVLEGAKLIPQGEGRKAKHDKLFASFVASEEAKPTTPAKPTK